MAENITNPKISINIATYNRADFIREAIESVLAQTFTDWELVIVDDGSTDKTAEIIAPFLSDPRLHYFKNETNRQISFTRNRARANSRGKYLAILDSDDAWSDHDKLAKQYAFLTTHPACLAVGTQATAVNPAGQLLKKISVPCSDWAIRQVILAKNPLIHSSVLYRREVVTEAGGYNLELNGIEDYDLWLRLGARGELANLPDDCVHYRVHPGNISLTDRARLMQTNITLVKARRSDYPHYRRAVLRRHLRYGAYRLLKLFSGNK